MDGELQSSSAATKRPLARKLVIDLSVMTVIGVMLALIGPFGSFGDPLAIRLMVWVGLAYAGYFIYSPVGWVVERMTAALDLPRVFLWVAGTLIATVPMAIVVWSLNQLNSPVYRVPGAEEALTHYAYVLIIGAGITLLFNVIELSGNAKVESASVPTPAPPASISEPRTAISPLLASLPDHLGSDIIALEMEDHYCRVHTALGSELVLTRLRDAMTQIDGIEGMQVHRSWWVARGAVEDIVRDGRNMRLKLARDVEAPVSRAKVSQLKAAGWI
ncbi:LytTR family DNA-binding domain-containing protein [Erythrobacter sp. THAF29]|uniref:LytTR family DNA-binding domain-containing protein n=1 Tax=Erythrobacter sp. THAF29 TaxID=2587851 RepID=UPI001268D42E|nr:LytTR family DNA-binding domain-containing protein [Erythrobacter sp. THAF29]QFT78956.1 LytTr DNA-binding domain protein [Erythrobacter sp. THAF29]